MIEMNFKQEGRKSFEELLSVIFALMTILFIVGLCALILCSFQSCSLTKVNNSNSQWYGGYYPGEIYEIYDKNTGVYYAITDRGGITPMYTIEGEVKLVDQGNEYVVHKNLGEPDAQE